GLALLTDPAAITPEVIALAGGAARASSVRLRAAAVLLGFGLAVGLGLAASSRPAAKETAAGPVVAEGGRLITDRHGDPLPSGALVRLGTLRLRHGAAVNGLAFSPT